MRTKPGFELQSQCLDSALLCRYFSLIFLHCYLQVHLILRYKSPSAPQSHSEMCTLEGVEHTFWRLNLCGTSSSSCHRSTGRAHTPCTYLPNAFLQPVGCAIVIVPWDGRLRIVFSTYTFQLDALTQAFDHRLRETVVTGGVRRARWEQVQCRDGPEAAGRPTVWEPALWVWACVFAWPQQVYVLYVHIYKYIYMTPYDISAYFIGQKETGVLAEWDNPCIFSHRHQKYSQAFYWRDIYPRVSFSNGILCNGTVPRPVFTLSVTTLSVCVCVCMIITTIRHFEGLNTIII